MKDAITRRGLPGHRELVIRVRRSLVILKKGLAQETIETKQMFAVYHRYTRGLASEEEMQLANRQFLDVIKGLGLSVVVILPFSPITLPAIVKLGNRVGIEVLPSAFTESSGAFKEEVDIPDKRAVLIEEKAIPVDILSHASEPYRESQEVESDYSSVSASPLKPAQD